ncbi:MAG: glycine--tRNA ligase subunit beta [Proteobacteria bacterium]|nr:glycine--tRNA ligase subunit beta [Pseudomonadota bacterium]MCL2307218.1 glycine--tRNA ligase subunit beta [Pseudomonadota bacterium]
MSSAPLLVELLTEELPPKALKRLSVAFAELLETQLRNGRFLEASSVTTRYATPRRLAVRITGVKAKAPDQPFTQKLLPVAIAFDAEGRPTLPLMRKLEALGLSEADLPRCKRESDGKAEALFIDGVTAGQTLQAGLQAALDQAIAQLPIPKVMRYPVPGGYYNDVSFVRPAHRLMALHGDHVVPVTALGLDAGQTTSGHRFLATASEIVISQADDYEAALETQGKVIASFDRRRERIVEGLQKVAGTARVVMSEELLDEVTALVEWPEVYEGRFDPAFLKVPQECLILTMQQNQKYFALTDNEGRLIERFLLVSNMHTQDPKEIIGGNERVLRARLADARFFFEQDCKKPLADRVDALASIVYFKGLGSQRERVDRLVKISQTLAALLGADAEKTARIALLAKADLTTDMVGEFPELQGTMGRYYARHDGENAVVAQGIEQHYWPRFAGDRLPESLEAVCVSMADKLETIAGMFAVNNQPTGDKDPFGLRRAAIGVLRMVIEKNLSISLSQLIGAATDQRDVSSAVELFFYDRLRGLLKEEGHATQAIEAVLTQKPDAIAQVPARLNAVRTFAALPEAEALAAANKRIVNILKKNAESVTHAEAQPALFRDDAEKALYAVFHERLNGEVETAMQAGDFTKALQVLAGARREVDRFFDEVMVMADDPAVRANRLALLNEIRQTMNRVADIAMLAG